MKDEAYNISKTGKCCYLNGFFLTKISLNLLFAIRLIISHVMISNNNLPTYTIYSRWISIIVYNCRYYNFQFRKNENTKKNTLLGDLYFLQLKFKRSDFFFFFILKYSKLHVDLICFTLDNKLLTKPTFLVTGVGPCDCWQRGSVFYRKEEIVQIFGDSQYANECTDN